MPGHQVDWTRAQSRPAPTPKAEDYQSRGHWYHPKPSELLWHATWGQGLRQEAFFLDTWSFISGRLWNPVAVERHARFFTWPGSSCSSNLRNKTKSHRLLSYHPALFTQPLVYWLTNTVSPWPRTCLWKKGMTLFPSPDIHNTDHRWGG